MKRIRLLGYLIAAFFTLQAHAQTHQTFIGNQTAHETVMDITYLGNGNTVSVGQRSGNVNGSNADALILVKDPNNNVIWSRVFAGPSEDGFAKVMVASNGDIIAVGRTGNPARGLMCRYTPTGTIIWERSYNATSPATTNGEVFTSVCQNPTDRTLYVCGGTDAAPDVSDAIVTSIDFNNGNVNWCRRYDLTATPGGPKNTDCSDAFVSIAFFNGRLYTLGFFQRDYVSAFYDMDVFCLDLTGLEQWRRRVALSVNSAVGPINNTYPVDLLINNQGSFIISLVMANDFSVTGASVSTVLGGQVTPTTFTINNAYTYRNLEGFAFDNTCKVIPTNANYTDFLLAQMPGTASYGNVNNFSVNNLTDARVMQINNFVTFAWAREFVHAGTQGIYSMALSAANDVVLAGSSLGAVNQGSTRDALLIETKLPITATDTFECGIRDRRNDVRQVQPVVTVENWISVPLTLVPNVINLTNDQLVVGGACGCIDSLTTVLGNDTVKSNTMFHGKYYVNGTLTVAPNVTLDITNVDMIFAQCGGINVLPGGHIRGNNSVFRPCIETNTWSGINLNNSQNNIFDECVFKNAQTALFVSSSSTARINNNYFQNCQQGITFSATTSDFPVSGNNFAHDNLYEALAFTCNATGSGQSVAIQFITSRLHSDVAHNSFVNGSAVSYIGAMVSFDSYVESLSQNDFTNMENSIIYSMLGYQQGEREMKIANNRIENTRPKEVFGSQILITRGTHPIRVENNIVYTDQTLVPTLTYAIEVINSDGAYVQSNTLTGYTAGVTCNRSNRINITDNKVFNALIMGVYTVDSREIDIRCNEIDMNHRGGGIGIDVDGGSFDVNVFTNCVSNCHISIDVDGSSDRVGIYNNFMYNYSYAGVLNNSTAPLSIGQPGQDGQNTFWSNDNSALDIFTTIGTTFVTNNFGVFNFNWPNTNILSSVPSHSTASCGRQIYDMPSQGNYRAMYDCDHIADFKKDAGTALATAEGQGYPVELIRYYLAALYKQGQGQAEQFYQSVQASSNVKAYNKAMLRVMYAMLKGDAHAAQQSLGEVVPGDKLQAAEVFLNKMLLKARVDGKDLMALSTDEILVLEEYRATEDHQLNDMYVLMNLNKTSHAMHYTPIQAKQYPALSSAVRVSTLHNGLSVYPSPAKSTINVLINSTDATGNKVLVVYNMLGQEVMRDDLQIVSGGVSIDVSKLASGNYMAVVLGGETKLQAKFTKE